MRRVVVVVVAVSLAWGWSSKAWSQAEGDAAAVQPVQDPATVTIPLLSSQAMDALVAGIAFYSDEVIEQILDAAQNPDAIEQATRGVSDDAVAQAWPASVQYLVSYPEILAQLHQNATTTARLALASRTQLADVWRAIDRVRLAYEQQMAESSASDTLAVPANRDGAVVYPPAAFLAGYWTAAVVSELDVWYRATATVVYGATRVVGPRGTSVTAAGAGGQLTVGDTTYYGAAGGGSLVTANGVVVQGTGQVHGNVTATENGGSYESHASGAVSSNTGKAGYGEHHAQGSYQKNADGSIDFSRTANTNTASSAGASHIEHSGSGTYTGQGTGSYQGTTEVQSSHGDASVSTSVSDGQVTGSVTTDQGTHSFATGAGERNGLSSTQRLAPAGERRSTARPKDVGAVPSRFSQASPQQLQAASRAMTSAWGGLGKESGLPSSVRSSGSSPFRANRPTTPAYARPQAGLSGALTSPSPGIRAPAPSSRSVSPSPNRGGARRGRR